MSAQRRREGPAAPTHPRRPTCTAQMRWQPPASPTCAPAVSGGARDGVASSARRPLRAQPRTHFFSQRRTRPENSLNRSDAAILRTPDIWASYARRGAPRVCKRTAAARQLRARACSCAGTAPRERARFMGRLGHYDTPRTMVLWSSARGGGGGVPARAAAAATRTWLAACRAAPRAASSRSAVGRRRPPRSSAPANTSRWSSSAPGAWARQ